MPFIPNSFFLPTIFSPETGGGVAPDVPGNFAVYSRTVTTITVTWDAVPDGVVVRAQLQVAGGDWTSINDIGGVTSPCEFDNLSGVPLVANTSYDVRVRAEVGSAHSDWVTLTSQYTLPAIPTGLATAAGDYAIVNLIWDSPVAGFLNVYVNGSLAMTGISLPYGDYNDSSPNNTSAFTISFVSNASGFESAQSTPVNGTSGSGRVPANNGAPIATDQGTCASITDDGSWTADPTSLSFSYQWQYNGVDIPGEEFGATFYTLAGFYSCNLTASNAVGSTTKSSNSVYFPGPG